MPISRAQRSPSTQALTASAAPAGAGRLRATATALWDGGVAAVERSRAELQQVLGDITNPNDARYNYNELGKPKSAEEAFRSLPATSVGQARVRRFADDNVGSWNQTLETFRNCEHNFLFAYYSIYPDAFGHAYLGAALLLQLQGKQVTGVLDWGANSTGFASPAGVDYLQELTNKGANIGIYNTLEKRIKRFFEHGLSLGMLSANHDKIEVADAFTPKANGKTGGRNVGAPYSQAPSDDPTAWRDNSVHVIGDEATRGLAKAVERERESPAYVSVKPERINLVNRSREMLTAYALMEAWVAHPPLTERHKRELRTNGVVQEEMVNALMAEAAKRVDAMVAPLSKAAKAGIPDTLSFGDVLRLQELTRELIQGQALCGSRATYEADKAANNHYIDAEVATIDQMSAASAAPKQRYNEMAPSLLHLIHGAQKEIVIQNPYVVLTEPMMVALEEAAKRGVKITIVTNSPASTDSAVTQGFFLNDWPDFLARVPTAKLFVATGERKFHAKCMTIDGQVSADLSFNADLLSGRINGEVGAISLSKALARLLNDAIAADLANKDNGFKEWTIEKDDKGRPVIGKDGRAIVKYGPKDDMPSGLMRKYKPMQAMCAFAAQKTDTCAPLHHPPLAEALAASGFQAAE